MASARPRRSTVPVSYQTVFPNLSSSSSEGEEGDEEEENGEEGVDANGAEEGGDVSRVSSKRGKAGEKDDDDDSEKEVESDSSGSGSEYAPEVIKTKDGKVQVVDDSEDSAEFSEGDGEPEEDGDDSEAGEAELEGSGETIIGGALKKGKNAVGRGGHSSRIVFIDGHEATGGQKTKTKAPTSAASAPNIRITSRVPAAVLEVTNAGTNKKAVAKRKKMNASFGRPARTPIYELSYLPTFLPPQTILTHPFDDPIHCATLGAGDSDVGSTGVPTSGGTDTQSGIITVNQTPAELEATHLHSVKRVGYVPFGPRYDTCQDYGWHKGKWREVGACFGTSSGDLSTAGKNMVSAGLERSARWGGWYPTIETRASQYEVIKAGTAVAEHLPKNIYPAVPQPVHLHCDTQDQTAQTGGKEEEADDDDDAVWSFRTTTPSTLGEDAQDDTGGGSNANPLLLQAIRQSNTTAPSAGPSSTKNAAQEGKAKFYIGPVGPMQVGDSENGSLGPQELVELARFESVRLGERQSLRSHHSSVGDGIVDNLHASQTPMSVSDADDYLPRKPGWILNAGGPVFGLDWCPVADEQLPTRERTFYTHRKDRSGASLTSVYS